MTTTTDPSRRDRWAQLRFSIIGPLFAAPPPPGELQARLAELAAITWRHPITGEAVQFGLSTLERWYYRARQASDPVSVFTQFDGVVFMLSDGRKAITCCDQDVLGWLGLEGRRVKGSHRDRREYSRAHSGC